MVKRNADHRCAAVPDPPKVRVLVRFLVGVLTIWLVSVLDRMTASEATTLRAVPGPGSIPGRATRHHALRV